MARRRGFFAELQHQSQLTAKRNTQQQAAFQRAQVRAAAEAQRTLRDAERAQAQAVRFATLDAKAAQAERKTAEAKALRLHREARRAEVDSLNAELASAKDQIDSILAATLAVDDFVDLNQLRSTITHPAFEVPPDLAPPTPDVPVPMPPPAPAFQEPAAPRGLAGLVGGKRKHLEAVAAARTVHERATTEWRAQVDKLESDTATARRRRDELEHKRLARIDDARTTYETECADREIESAEQNERLDKLIGELAFDVPAAITEYVGIVLSNSIYPEVFPVEHDYEFDLATRELTLKALIPPPDTLPATKEYRYVQSRDEITSTSLPQKEVKERYSSAVAQTAIRSLHEIFEADRAAKIQLIALAVAVARIDPATGQPAEVPLLAVAVDRPTFTAFDLGNVVPLATLQHLGALISKSCFDLVPIELAKSVQRR